MHLRPRTAIIAAVMRVRDTLSWATHQFFHSQGFLYLHTPLIITSDCEGVGEMFQVAALCIILTVTPLSHSGAVTHAAASHATHSPGRHRQTVCTGSRQQAHIYIYVHTALQ